MYNIDIVLISQTDLFILDGEIISFSKYFHTTSSIDAYNACFISYSCHQGAPLDVLCQQLYSEL